MQSSTNSPLDLDAVTRSVRQNVALARKLRRRYAAHLSILCRVLLVSTFVEDGFRILFEMRNQVDFLSHEYSIPSFIATIMLLANISVSFVAIVFILARKHLARGHYENIAAYSLIGCVFYQQLLYGRHSPIGSGNLGFFMRNLCLSGSLLLITCQSRMAEGRSALPMGLLDGQASNEATVAYLQLASRVLLVLLGLEFISTLGILGAIMTLPVIIAVLAGFYLEISASILLLLYFLHNILQSSFWSVRGSYMSQIMQYEFFQTLSIMGGLLLLIMTGPGAISVDEFRSRKAF